LSFLRDNNFGDWVFLRDNTFQLFQGSASTTAPLPMPVGARGWVRLGAAAVGIVAGDFCYVYCGTHWALGGGIKRWCASDVCLSCTSGLSQEHRDLGKLKLAEVAHVTHDSDTTFKVKRSKVNLQGRGHVEIYVYIYKLAIPTKAISICSQLNMIVCNTAINAKISFLYFLYNLIVLIVASVFCTNVRWASEPSGIVEYIRVADVDIAVVVAADVVLLTSFDIRRISHSQHTIFTDQ